VTCAAFGCVHVAGPDIAVRALVLVLDPLAVRVRPVNLNHVEYLRVINDDDGLVDLGRQAHESDLHDCQTSPQSPHSSAYSSARSPVVMRVSLMFSVFPHAGQATAESEAVKSATVA